MKSITYPLIIVNFKTYIEGTGKHALELAKIIEKISNKKGICIAIAAQVIDINKIASETAIPVFAQHLDPINPGSNTGYILAEAIKEAGAIGTLINHSERKLQLADIDKIVQISKEKQLFTCVCASTPKIAGAVAVFSPDCCAIEPPELIGTGISVSTAQPRIITETVEIMKRVNPNVVPLCGAGITIGRDVKIALELGTKGILLASGVVKAKNPENVLSEMAEKALEIDLE